ncbi:hypothetical protein [Botrimarina mediterranea]|uniref:Uncharacterized protein n=1 Tax=Botrimarina mediterranea TaxID=2528022 RepID=A0A518K644_9BACT|nr:hypothetical protein [Botrimarina mediterranea]QDV73247.1 hypothetical protein Spa11_14430 [Botrimarina mediterranea]
MPQDPELKVDDAMPSAAALRFVKGSVGDPKKPVTTQTKKTSAAEGGEVVETGGPDQPTRTARAESQRRPRQQPKPVESQPTHYVLLSTKIRPEIKRRLAEVRHQRVMANDPVCTLKQFIEEAVESWLKFEKTGAQPHSSGASQPTASSRVPREPFNNQIRVDLKRMLMEASHRRKMRGNPSHTILAVVEEAITAWLGTGRASR